MGSTIKVLELSFASMAARQPTQSVSKINPLLPIAVLLVTSAQAYKLLHKFILSTPQAEFSFDTCVRFPRRYFDTYGGVDLASLDKITCILVRLFNIVIRDPLSRILLAEFLGLITVIMLIGLICSRRSSAGGIVKSFTTLAFVAMQFFGGAVVLPLYFVPIVWKSSSSARASFIPSASARALLPAVIIGLLVPSVSLLYPELFQSQHMLDWTIAVWQIFPITVSSLATALSVCFGGSDGKSLGTTDAVISTSILITSFDTTILLSIALHIYSIYASRSQELSLSSFWPKSNFRTEEEAFYSFFAIDLLGCMTAIWTLIFYDTSRYAGVGKTSILSAALLAVFGTVVLGPGGATAVSRFTGL